MFCDEEKMTRMSDFQEIKGCVIVSDFCEKNSSKYRF